MASTGKVTEAVQSIAYGIGEMHATGTTLWTPLFFSSLALANAQIGQLDKAWASLHDAKTAMETTKERWCEAEINRIAGEIALLGAKPDVVKAEAYFANALEAARKHQAKSWELRAAMSAARLLLARGARESAHDILAPVYAWFTQGFDSLDLRRAKSLLDELRREPSDRQINAATTP
jgi:predicted ATPase